MCGDFIRTPYTRTRGAGARSLAAHVQHIYKLVGRRAGKAPQYTTDHYYYMLMYTCVKQSNKLSWWWWWGTDYPLLIRCVGAKATHDAAATDYPLLIQRGANNAHAQGKHVHKQVDVLSIPTNLPTPKPLSQILIVVRILDHATTQTGPELDKVVIPQQEPEQHAGWGGGRRGGCKCLVSGCCAVIC